jgi:hypothetical protein
MKPVASASKDNYFAPLSSGSRDREPQYLVALAFEIRMKRGAGSTSAGRAG